MGIEALGSSGRGLMSITELAAMFRHRTRSSRDLLRQACDFADAQPLTADPLFVAAYVLWRICWIHPFDDGNGRTARAASYFVLCQRLWLEPSRAIPQSRTWAPSGIEPCRITSRRRLGDRCNSDHEVLGVEHQYSPLITKNEPRIVPASFDFWRANLNRSASSSGTSIPSESLKPTARFFGSSTVYITLIERPLS